MKKDIKTILDEVEFQFSRSSGSGGQNVNKRDTKAEIRWKSKSSKFDAALVFKIIEYFKKYKPSLLSSEDEVIIFCQDTRSREQNRKLALEKFMSIINFALTPAQKRKPTKVSKAIKLKRKRIKQMSSQKKQERRYKKNDEI